LKNKNKTEEKIMTKTKTTKRFAAILLTLAMAFGMFSMIGATSVSAATDKVSLYSLNPTFSKYGGTSFEAYIQTNDSASNQEVYVHYNYMDSMDWQDAKAEYVTTLNDGSKIWKANFSSWNTKFAIKFVADGREYWDNNNGNDYTRNDILGVAPVTSERLGYQLYGNKFQINAVLQNYAYQKNVYVRYTTDGWNSYNDQALGYDKTNENGTETWTTTLNLPSNMDYSKFEYAICYQVNGTEFWADNFGANYDAYYYIHH
jgi:hypothetical protein